MPHLSSRFSKERARQESSPFNIESEWNAPFNSSTIETDPLYGDFSESVPLTEVMRDPLMQRSNSTSTAARSFPVRQSGYEVSPTATMPTAAEAAFLLPQDTSDDLLDPPDLKPLSAPVLTHARVASPDLSNSIGSASPIFRPFADGAENAAHPCGEDSTQPARSEHPRLLSQTLAPVDRQQDAQQGRQRGRTGVDLSFEDDSLSRGALARLFFKNVWHTLKMWRLFLNLSCIDIRRRPCAFCLGIFSVLVVVLMCVVMLSVLSALPIVFLLLSESSRGMIDLQLRPGGQMSGARSLNYTMIEQLFPPEGPTLDRSYHAPRLFHDHASLDVLSRCENGTTLKDLWYKRGTQPPANAENDFDSCSSSDCVATNCPHSVRVAVLAYDRARENRMGLGAANNFPELGEKDIIVSHRVATLLGRLHVGDEVILYFVAGDLLRQAYPANATEAVKLTIVPLTVRDIVGQELTKFPELGDVFVLLSFRHFTKMVAANLFPPLAKTVAPAIAATNPNECASYVNFNLPPGLPRNRVYQSSSYATIRENVVAWASPIVTAAGFTQVNVNAPILSQLYETRMFSVFVGLIMSIIILALVFLSIMLVYALLTVGVETRTYDLGIQRMIGFTRENLVAMVLCNAYFFTIPAWLAGLGAGQGVYVLVRFVFMRLVAVELPIAISGSAVGWATLAGLLIPLVASIIPIWDLVTLRLSDALDTSHGRSSGVVYTIQRNDSERLSGMMLGLGLLFTVFGFLLYYLFPGSLMNQNLSLMFYIFFFVLIGMLAGLVLLATNFQRVVETVLLYVLLFWESRPVFRMVRKSLAAHRLRNRKTTLMYALSMAFILFITVAFDTQLTSFNFETYRSYGAEVMLTLRSATLMTYADLREHINENLVKRGMITGVTFTPVAFTGVSHPGSALTSQVLGSPGRYRTASTHLVPVPPNYYEVLDDRFLKVTRHVEAARRYSLSGALYTREGQNALLVSSSTFNFLGMASVGEGVAVLADTMVVRTPQIRTFYQRYAVTSVGSMEATPVLVASNFPSTFGDMLASIPTAARLSGRNFTSAMTLPVSTVFVRVPKKSDYQRVINSILAWNPNEVTWIDDIETATEVMKLANKVLNLFLIFTQLMILIICFFSLMSSMVSNVLDSSKEIAVLLCMGMSHFQLYRVYIWEAFILVLASGLLGLIVGTVVAYTMQMQNVLLTQLPLPFSFPYLQLVIIVGMGLVSAVASSISPVSVLLNMPSVTHILRRVAH